MAFTGIDWGTNVGGPADIHVLRGQVSRGLDGILVLRSNVPGADAWASARPLPGDVTGVAFNPIFNFTAAANGISVNAATGAVTAAALPAGAVNVPNFIVQATVTHTSAAAPNPLPPIPIRVHVHNAVTAITLSPDPLTVRVGSAGQRLTVLAEFDDGTVGNISFHPGITWVSTSPLDLTVAADGTLTAVNTGKNVLVSAFMPVDMGGLPVNGHVQTDVALASVPQLSLVPGSPGSAQPDLPNLLVLPDGFLAGEQAQFEALVATLVKDLASATTTFPLSLLRPNINFWTAFVPSRERGATALYGLRFMNRTAGKLSTSALPLPRPPDPVNGIQSVEQLLWQVGLPIPADHNVAFATKRADWNTVYGAAHTNGVTQAIYNKWNDLWDHTLATDCDTAFGLATGLSGPQVQSLDDGRVLQLHPFRTTRAHIDLMLAGLVATDGAAPIPYGPTWVAGKDQHQVIVLSAGARRAGAEGAVIACNLVDHSELLVTPIAGSHLVKVKPYAVPAKSSFYVRAIVAHEVGHSLKLGDEYGGKPVLTSVALLQDFWNLEAESALTNAAHMIDGTKIQWRWPRMIKAAVLQAPPHDLLGGNYRFTVGVGQGGAFTQNDIVRLRGRPLSNNLAPSAASFVVTLLKSTAAGDVMDVQIDPGATPIVPLLWPAGTVVYVPRLHPTTLQELTLVDDRVENWTTATGLPLNRLVMACTNDGRAVQPAVNKPLGLTAGKPKYSAWIIGLDDGGREFDCGVFHPSGACIMRNLQVSTAANANPDVPYLFCGVCRYILADILDPTIHPVVDDEFQKYFSLT